MDCQFFKASNQDAVMPIHLYINFCKVFILLQKNIKNSLKNSKNIDQRFNYLTQSSMIAKKFNISLYNIKNYSLLVSFSKVNSRNHNSLSWDHLRPTTKIYQGEKIMINRLITKMDYNILLKSSYIFSTVPQSQVKDKQILEVFQDIVTETKNRCQKNGQYTLLYLISKARQIYPRLQSSRMQYLIVLSKKLHQKAQSVKEVNQKTENSTKRKTEYENSIAQLSFWLLLRIYVSSVAFSKVCLNIYSLDPINLDVHRNATGMKRQGYSQKIMNEVLQQMTNILRGFDSFKLRYKESEVHKKLQKYITEGLEEFSLCRKKYISSEEKNELMKDQNQSKLGELKRRQEKFLRQMTKLRQAILTSNYRKVNELYLVNSLLRIMSNQSLKRRQAKYLQNSVQRLRQLSQISAISFAEKWIQILKKTESPDYRQRRTLIQNISEVTEEIKFMVKRLIAINEGLQANEVPPFKKFVANCLKYLFFALLILLAIVGAVVMVMQTLKKFVAFVNPFNHFKNRDGQASGPI